MSRPPVVVALMVGNSKPGSPETRNVDRAMFHDGWRGVYREQLEPLAGGRFPLGTAFCLRNPFGTPAGRDMELDQWLEAKKLGLDWLTDDFVAETRAFVARTGCPVIPYLGYAGTDPDFLRRRRRVDQADDYLRRYEQSLRPALDAGCGLVLDAVGDLPRVSVEHGVALALRALLAPHGRAAAVEWMPRATSTHWHDFPVWIIDESYRWALREFPGRYDPTLLTGGVYRMVESLPAGETWQGYLAWGPRVCREILRDGHVPVVYHGHYLSYSAKDLTWDQFLALGSAAGDPVKGDPDAA